MQFQEQNIFKITDLKLYNYSTYDFNKDPLRAPFQNKNYPRLEQSNKRNDSHSAKIGSGSVGAE